MEVLPIFFGLFYLFIWNSKVEFNRMKKGQSPLVAEIYEYRLEKSPMRNDYTKLNYPYVNFKGKDRLHKLKYAKSWTKPFSIGSEVPVFWHAGVLYYWHAMDKGIYRLVPGRWDVWSYKKN